MLLCFTASHSFSEEQNSTTENDPAQIPVDAVVDWYGSSDPSVPSGTVNYEYADQFDETDLETHYRTPNLIEGDKWDGATYGADPGGCCASISGSGALYDTTTDTILFSYGMDTIQQVIAINQVFANTGISVDGYTYDMMFKRIENNGGRTDELYVDIIIKDANGNEVEDKTYNLSGLPNQQWEYFSAMQLFPNHYSDPQNATVRIRGKDGGFWAGYYGPEIKDVDFRLIYRSDPCGADPLYDPSCSGYANAYANKMLEEQLEKQLEEQQKAAMEPTKIEEQKFDDGFENAPEETIVTFTPTPVPTPVQLGGTETAGTNDGNPEPVSRKEERDSKDDQREKLDLVRNLNEQNSFDVSEVSGAPITSEDSVANDIVSSAEATSINLTTETINKQMSQSASSSFSSQATLSAEMNEQRRNEIKKQLTEERAKEIAESTKSAESVDEQTRQQSEQLALMAFVPGFDSYQVVLPGGYYPDVDFYEPKNIPNSRQGLRNGLAQQLLHEKMMDMQYDR